MKPRELALRQLYVLVVKELRQLFRDRILFFFTIYLFTGHIIVTTMGASDDLRRAATVVYDGDRSASSRDLAGRLRPPYFDVTGEVSDPVAGSRALDDGNAQVFVNIPDDFSEKIGRADQQASVQVLVDTSKTSLGYLASNYTSRVIEELGASIAADRLARAGVVEPPPRIENRTRTWYNFALDMRESFSLQSLIMMISVCCVMLPATAAVREKEKGTIEQLLVSPVSALQIMLSKIVAMVVVTLAGTALGMYGILEPVFGISIRGSAPLFFAIVALYAFALSGLGLVLATLARSSGQVGLLVILTVVPMLFLSGTSTPIGSMPLGLQWAIQALPLYHFVHIAYGIVFRGEGLGTLWSSALAIVAIGAVLLVVGTRRFRAQYA